MDNFEWGRDWLYHKESVLKRDPLFDGLDWEIASIMARGGVWTGDDPDTMFAAAFGLDMTLKKGYLAGMKLGEYHVGKGILVMNGFNLPPANLGEHLSFGLNSAECCFPAADRLFLNLLKRYGG